MVPITQIQGVPIADRVEVTAGSLPARYFGRDVHEGGLLSCAEAAALTSLGLLAVSSHADEGASPRQQSTTLAGHERLTAIMARFLEEGYVVRSGLKFDGCGIFCQPSLLKKIVFAANARQWR
eukprot:GEMP01087748.1.p1 GENE.GEMP01087748.1~~GEMP01087748.1.p1  ORF type:complete len:123 (+),score=27.17 GEMP01087748.1:190-558(+)